VQWKATIRTDLLISYGVVFVFAVAMTMVGAFLLYGQGFTISDNGAMFAMADSLGASLGGFVRLVFLLSFLAVVYTSVLGG
ncbi:divalent metal cation transporter, partial [Xanthomonas citri pv. citri]|nr:divalent metal cation transporter [Xanthomonas citri pv. citri]